MSVSVTGGKIPDRGGFAKETLSASTATTPQAIALTTELTVVGGGTGTGFEVNVFTLSTASAIEGQTKTVMATATCEAKVAFTGTATGRLVLAQADDMIEMRYLDGKWRIIQTTATVATAT